MTDDAHADPAAEGWRADTPAMGVLLPDPIEAVGAPPETDEAVESAAAPRKKKSSLRSLLEWVVVIGVALIVAVGVRTFVFQPFWIPSESMEKTLDIGDRVLVNKLSYHLHDIHRGDVVVFDQPESWPLAADIKDLIKRVVGLPGDTVEIRDRSVFINGQRLVEKYVLCDDPATVLCTDPAETVLDPDQDGKFVVPEKMIFVMGDNRQHSSDSRFNGFVPKSDVVGRAFVVIWPHGHWGWL